MRDGRRGDGREGPDPIEQVARELDDRSPGFAARLRERAPLLRGELPAELVAAFAGLLRRLAVLEGPGRDAAQALASLGPADLIGLGVADLDAWCVAAESIGTVSARAASSFAAAAIRALPARGEGRAAALAAAAAAVAGLAARHGGDPLVQRFAAASGAALDRHGGEVVEAWAAACEGTAFGQRRPVDIASRLPEAPGLGDAHLAASLRLVARLAPRDRDRAQRLATHLPQELAHVPAADRTRVVEMLRLLERSGEALADAVEIVAPVLRRVPARSRAMVVDLASAVARRMPAAASRYLRTVLRVGEAVDWGPSLAAFVERGLSLAAENEAAAIAFFSLESRGSRAFLQRHDVAVLLEDVEATLRGYLHLITRGRPTLAGSPGGGLFPPVADDPAAVPVSARCDVFPTWEENFTLLKLQATLATEFGALGTRDFALGRWLGGDETGGLPDLYRRFEQPEAAAGLLVHLEAARGMPRLARLYPGLAADVAELRARVFPGGRPRDGHGAAEAVMFLALGGDPAGIRFAGAWGEALSALAEGARAGTATIYDSVTALEVLCERLAAGELIPIYGLESYLEEDLNLSYMLDEGEEAGPAVADPRAPGPDALPDPQNGQGERSDETSPGAAADLDLLRAYLEQRPDLTVLRAEGPIDPMGLFVSGLTGGGSPEERKPRSQPSLSPEAVLALARHGHRARGVFLHDEWDYLISDYRYQWCRVLEIAVDGDDGAFFAGTLARYSDMLPEVRRQFQRVKPEGYRVIHGLFDGEDFDFNAVVMARADLRARRSPSPKLYTARQREERDVATLFLLDMSASTDEDTEPPPPPPGADEDPPADLARALAKPGPSRRIIDIQKEAIVIMAQALEEIGDMYAIYGFSGHGRDCVEFFDVKSFDEPLSPAVRARIGAIEPQRSTRMGAALRQATLKLRAVASRAKHLILLSDGFPQDFDYGEDRRSNVYGLRDTTMALREAQQAGVQPFCITVDRAGHDYLREMCDAKRYLVIEDIAALPRELPKIYSEATRGG